MTRYRFTRDDFALIFDELTEKGQCDLAEVFMRVGNMIIESWEQESQKLYGFENVETGEIQVWSQRGKAKLKREDYTHVAVVWNPRKFEECK